LLAFVGFCFCKKSSLIPNWNGGEAAIVMQTEQIWNSLSFTIVWKKFTNRELEKKQQQEFNARD
jgi:hypothetical protein